MPGAVCRRCGTRTAQVTSRSLSGNSGSAVNSHHVVARGFSAIFGLHPAIAFFTIAANVMMGGVDTLSGVLGPVTLGISMAFAILLSSIVGFFVGVTAYLGQKKWYGDDTESARVKALIVGILTAIPVALPGILFGSVALVRGLFFRRR
jgi:hypothetical protein